MADTDDTPSPVDPETAPTSFSAFKPRDHVVLGFPDQAPCDRATQALTDSGITGIRHVPAEEMRSSMADMLDRASGSAEFGHEAVEMRKYLALSAQGYHWLVVPASGDDAQGVVDTVQPLGAKVAVHYGLLLITDLL